MSLPTTFRALTPAKTQFGEPQFEDLPIQKPGKNQVLVKIAYAPLHPYDIVFMRSSVASVSGENIQIVGNEGSGTIVAVGEDLNNPLNVGQKVHVIGDGTFAEYYLAETEKVFPVQGDISLEEAANHYSNPPTVYYIGLTAQKGGHKAVVHTAGASALGKMMIRLFKTLGITLINIVRKDQQVEELKQEGADYVLNSEDPNFEQNLKELAHRENATMAMDAIGGEFTTKIFKALPPHSVTYVYGALSNQFTVNGLDISELFKGKTISGFTLYDHYNELKEKGEYRNFITEVHKLLPTVFKTKVDRVFPLSQFNEALEYYNKNASKGKVLLKPN